LLQRNDNTVKLDDDNLGSWGHEFVRSLAGEIGQEYNARVLAGADPENDEAFADLLNMVDVIVPFHISHNAEAEAVDLLIEIQRLSKLKDLSSVDEKNYSRICLYLIKTADFMSDPDDLAVSFIRFVVHPVIHKQDSQSLVSMKASLKPRVCFLLFLLFLFNPRLPVVCIIPRN